MNKSKAINQQRERRGKRARARVFGVATKPRLAIFRSNQAIYAQLVNDEKHSIILAISSRNLKLGEGRKNKTEQARLVGAALAEKAVSVGIKTAVLDRGHYRYQGRVLALVEAAKKSGLKI